MEITWRVISGEEGGRIGGKGTEIRSIIGMHNLDRRRLRIV